MFDFFFGWRKASKCKKLIRRVQCRLKLLKNKRCSIVRMLREDIAELLRHGHKQTAFDRVEQLYKDENTVAVYDMLDNFCEFVIINLPYIRKSKDCPNDINEAVSSLIYASARFGDLPELISVRKLFGQRYGERFAAVALDLLPGNLVNRQMKEKFCMQSISEDVKYKLVEEIARSCSESGPLLIEYNPKWQPELANKSDGDQILSIDFVMKNDRNENGKERVNSSIPETEPRVLYIDFSSESNKFVEDSTISVPSSCFPTSEAASNAGDFSMHDKQWQVIKSVHLDTVSGPRVRETAASTRAHPTGFSHDDMTADSSSESSDKLPKEMIYLDDIEEFESPVSKEGNFQDQRLFMFISAINPSIEKIDNRDDESLKERSESKGSRSDRKKSGKRMRKRLIPLDKRSITDRECEMYYGELCESSPNCNHNPHLRRNHHKTIGVKKKIRSNCTQGNADVHSCFVNVSRSLTGVECIHHLSKSCCRCSFSGKKVSNCSLDDPCYRCSSDETEDWKHPASMSMTKNETLKRLSAHSPTERTIKHQSGYYKPAAKEEPDICETPQTAKGDHNNLTSLENNARSVSVVSTSSRVTNQRKMKEIHPPYIRAMTMPPERLTDNSTDNFIRSKSFPVNHVHPKLPDYDELAAKFMALKKAHLQNKQYQSTT